MTNQNDCPLHVLDSVLFDDTVSAMWLLLQIMYAAQKVFTQQSENVVFQSIQND